MAVALSMVSAIVGVAYATKAGLLTPGLAERQHHDAIEWMTFETGPFNACLKTVYAERGLKLEGTSDLEVLRNVCRQMADRHVGDSHAGF